MFGLHLPNVNVVRVPLSQRVGPVRTSEARGDRGMSTSSHLSTLYSVHLRVLSVTAIIFCILMLLSTM